MATQDQHDAQGAPDAALPSVSGPLLGAKGASRRRFAKAAGAGAGVILTLASQPGMATELCASPSRSLSLAHSGKPGTIPACAGRTPLYWSTNTAWPGGIDRDNTLFGQVFNASADPQYGNATMLKMCGGPGFDKSELGANLAATYLNVLAGLISFLTVQDVKDMWNEVAASGVYKPSSTTTWQPFELVNYLKKTMS